MDSPRRKWDDDRLDQLETRIDRKFSEIDAQQSRFKRALRNRPTKRQINERFADLTGSASRGQIWVAAIGAAALVIAAIISGVVDVYNTPSFPTK
jgi:hypothetical protein